MMMSQLLIGLAVILATAFVHAVVLSDALRRNARLTAWAQHRNSVLRVAVALASSLLWVMSAHLVEVGLWSVTFLALGVFEGLEPSVYFSLVAYTTLGFGDILLPEAWRLLGGLAAANGFMAFGWSTAFQVRYLSRLGDVSEAPEAWI